MTYKDFEIKIRTELSDKFSVTPNPNRKGLNNIFYEGRNYDLPVVADEVKEEIDPNYRYEFPHGASVRMWAIPEIVGRLETFLKQVNGGELQDLYSNE